MAGAGGKHLLWRAVRLGTGWALLLLGIAGLFLPLIPGILFLASGLAVLSGESRWARRILERIRSWRRGRQIGKGTRVPD